MGTSENELKDVGLLLPRRAAKEVQNVVEGQDIEIERQALKSSYLRVES